MESLRQLLDLSEMKRALEMLKEEVERVEPLHFDESAFEQQMPSKNESEEEAPEAPEAKKMVSNAPEPLFDEDEFWKNALRDAELSQAETK